MVSLPGSRRTCIGNSDSRHRPRRASSGTRPGAAWEPRPSPPGPEGEILPGQEGFMLRQDRGSLTAGLALAGLCVFTGAVRADEASPAPARFRFGGAVAVAAPTGEFARNIDVAGGLTGFALYGRPHSPLALRADASFLLYGTETLQRPGPGTNGQVLEDVATTDNWIAQLAVGPHLMARSGRVRPYAHAFAGVSYFATTSELVFPRPTTLLVVPGAPPVVAGQDP